MSRRYSEARARRKAGWPSAVSARGHDPLGSNPHSSSVTLAPLRSAHGFTFVEVAIGVIITGLLVVGITRFFTDSHRSFNLREKITERDQNGHYVLKHLEDRLREAGANLPDTGTPLIVPSPDPAEGFELVINPRGGVQTVYSDLPPGFKIPVDDHAGFKEASALLLVPQDKSRPPAVLAVDVAYNQDGYVKGLKDAVKAQDTLRIAAPRTFRTGDRLYAYSRHRYVLRDGKFTMKGLVLAENLDSLAVVFRDAAGNPTNDWYSMRSVRLAVRVRTSEPDLAHTPDVFRKALLTSEVRLRNCP